MKTPFIRMIEETNKVDSQSWYDLDDFDICTKKVVFERLFQITDKSVPT